MKPYLVQRVEYKSGERVPAEGTSPMFVLARSPKAAAVKAAGFRSVHEGRGHLTVRVTRLEDEHHPEDAARREYTVNMPPLGLWYCEES